jgi:uncharacterized damage-inducible protein DinB
MSNLDSEIASAFIAQSRWMLATEYPTKLRACLTALPAAGLWHRPAEGTNSIGNLLLHLSGNVRQWIISGVGGAPDARERNAEFAAESGPPAAELFAQLRATVTEADAVLARLTPRDLLQSRDIQGRSTSVLEAVYHVTEHFGMPTGQIIQLTKLLAPGTISYYDDAGGLAVERWRDLIGR